jgi:hypothetical protein
VGLVYDPRELLGVTTVRPGVAGVLHTSCWDHVVLHATDLVQLRPTTYHTNTHSAWYMKINQVFPICENLDVLYTHQFHHQSELLWPSNKIGGYQSSFIIKYLKPLTGDLFTTRSEQKYKSKYQSIAHLLHHLSSE